MVTLIKEKYLAERSFDLRTSGLWAQHASTAPLCFLCDEKCVLRLFILFGISIRMMQYLSLMTIRWQRLSYRVSLRIRYTFSLTHTIRKHDLDQGFSR